MVEHINFYLESIFGPDQSTLTIFQMAMRAFVVYFLGIIILRFNKRFMSVRTVYNFFLYILLGSFLAAVIMGLVDLLHSIGTIIVIIGMNILTNMISFYFPTIETILKGKPVILIQDGKIQWSGMRETWITKDELMDALHANNISDVAQVKTAFFENSGRITVLKK